MTNSAPSILVSLCDKTLFTYSREAKLQRSQSTNEENYMETPEISPLIRFLDKIITQSFSSIEAHYQKRAVLKTFCQAHTDRKGNTSQMLYI
jgi:hypothetical protein